MGDLGRWLVVFGGFMIVMGILLMVLGRLPWPGRLPGDIVIKRDNFVFYAPLGTMILLSVVLTVLLNIIFRLFR
ncbi:MAG TPA: DUF2905 domain-containing protein [Caldilineae bacterium]|nr:DUF2905 domain-containing protein [Caldilineae bacterium]